MTLEEQVKIVKDALADKKAVDVKAYDVRGISGFADAFVVATGTAAPHLKALVAGTQAAMKEAGVNSPEARAYYALEKLWETAQPL